MYLSRMYLNPHRRKTRAFLANPEMLHAAVECTYHSDPSTDRRSLWRIEKEADRVTLYTVTPQVPSFEVLQEQVGWSQQQTWDSRDYSVLLDRLMTGQQYHFKLTANPTRTVTDANGKKRRKAEIGPRNQLQWLISRAEEIGANFGESTDKASAMVTRSQKLGFSNKGNRVTVIACTFEGTLTVTDPQKLQRVLIEGVGRAKAYGCGLLTLAPIQSVKS